MKAESLQSSGSQGHSTMCWIALVCFLTGSASAQGISIPVQEFRQLNIAEQRVLVIESLTKRVALSVANISYEVDTAFQNYEFNNGVLVKPIAGSESRSQIRHWRIGDSYRMDTGRSPKLDADVPYEQVSSGFDAVAGMSRGTVYLSAKPNRVFARIDVIHDRVSELNRYSYWLDGQHSRHAEFIFRYLLDHQSEIVVEAGTEGETIEISVPWQPRWSDKPLGERRFVLDPAKGFLPMAGHGRREDPADASWRFEDFEVGEARLVGDLWIPIKLREIIGGSPLGPEKVAVYDTTVLSIELGKVTPADLVVAFPKGTEVVDAIKGMHYTTDANEKPAGPVQGLVGADAVTALPQTNQPTRAGTTAPYRLGLLLINVGVAVVLVAAFFYRRSRRPN